MGRNRGGARFTLTCPEELCRRAASLFVHTEARFLVLANDRFKVDISRDAAVLIGTVEGRGNGNINLPNLSLTVELAHGLLLLTSAASPRRSTETSVQARMGYETLRCYT